MRIIIIGTGAIGAWAAGCLSGAFGKQDTTRFGKQHFASSVGLVIADDFRELSLQENLLLLCETEPAI